MFVKSSHKIGVAGGERPAVGVWSSTFSKSRFFVFIYIVTYAYIKGMIKKRENFEKEERKDQYGINRTRACGEIIV